MILKIHPVIRITCLLIVGIFVVSADPKNLLLTLFILAIGFVLSPRAQLLHCGRILRRLKWLFFSILLIYISLTPGRPIFESLQDWLTYEGLYLGLLRVSALVILILAVNLLIQVKQQTELSYAIIWLLSPLKNLGFPVEKLAVRISLTFKYIDELQTTLSNIKTQDVENSKDYRNDKYGMGVAPPHDAGPILLSINRLLGRFTQFFDQAISRSVILIEEVINRVEMPHAEHVENTLQRVPRLYQWLLPLGLVLMYVSV